MSGEDAADPRRRYVRTALITFVISFVITTAVTLLSYQLPIDLTPNLALCQVMGVIFGPFASLGVDMVSFSDNFLTGVPLPFCILDFMTVFAVSYVPYKLWYTVLFKDGGEPPTLKNVRNVVRFILVMVAATITYTVLYNLTFGLLYGTYELGTDDMARFLSVLSFSIIYGMAIILLSRYFGIPIYVPQSRLSRYNPFRKVRSWIFDVSLVVGLAFPVIFLHLFPAESNLVPATVVTYAFVLLFMAKPIRLAEIDDESSDRVRVGADRFNSSLIEKMIVLILIFGLIVGVFTAWAAYEGIINQLPQLTKENFILFLMGGSMVVFFIPAIFYLWYVERNVSIPLGRISKAARNYVMLEGSSLDSDQTLEAYSEYLEEDSEVGDLARSLTSMTIDIGEYIEDISILNKTQDMYKAELSVAMSIQQSLVPKDFDSVSGMNVDVFGSMTAAKYVGGDFYDFYAMGDGRFAFVIGDVSGKGVPAAIFMAVTRSVIRAYAAPGRTTGEILSMANDSLCSDNDEGMFVTVWMGILDVEAGTLQFSNAGHCKPVLMTAGEDPRLLVSKPGLVMGVREGIQYRTENITMGPLDRILLYTDGVTEANDNYSGFYGEDRLIDVCRRVRDAGAQGVVSEVLDDLTRFYGDAEQFDDITMFAVEFRGPADGDGD